MSQSVTQVSHKCHTREGNRATRTKLLPGRTKNSYCSIKMCDELPKQSGMELGSYLMPGASVGVTLWGACGSVIIDLPFFSSFVLLMPSFARLEVS